MSLRVQLILKKALVVELMVVYIGQRSPQWIVFEGKNVF